jgi:lipopolysaccharide transport system ATP-binding protein
VTHAVRFEEVTKRYPRGWSEGEEPRYASLRHDLASVGKRTADRIRGRTRQPMGTLALQDVSFEVEEGESFGIIGPNGAGKSTALKLISRISYPTSGRVRTRGRVAALMEVGSGVHPELTGRENIWLYGQILGMSRADIRRRFDEIVEFSDLTRAIDTPVKFFSSGMQLRLGFSIAVHLEPDIFVVDEALAVGDASFQVKCVEKMTALVASGRTLLFVSHSLPVVRDVCTRGLLLDRGRVDRVDAVGPLVDRYLERVGEGLVADRRGHDLLTVESFRVSSLDGDPRSLGTGCPIEVELRVDVRDDLSDAVLGFGVSDGRAGNLMTASMLSDRTSVALPRGGSVIRCAFGPVPLLPGQYEVWFAVNSGERATYYLEPRVVGTLVLTEGPEARRGDALFAQTGGYGPVYTEHRITVEHA